MKLYYTPGACSLAPHIVLNELKLPYELVLVKRDEPPPGYDKIRPLGGVPALVTDEGKVFNEGVIMLQYLADKKPEAGLVPPPTSPERYDLQETLNFLSTEIHKGYGPFFGLARAKLDEKTAETMKEFYRGNLRKRLDVLEARLSKSQFLVGNKYSIADAYLFVMLRWSPKVGIELSNWPHLADFVSRVNDRSAVHSAIKAEEG